MKILLIPFFYLFCLTNLFAQKEFGAFEFKHGRTKDLVFDYNQIREESYINCKRELKVYSPTFCSNFNPKFECKSCEYLWDSFYYNLTLTQTKVIDTIKVFQNKTKLAEFEIIAKFPPSPEIQIYYKRTPNDIRRDSFSIKNRFVKFTVVPRNEYFIKNYPSDARYKVREILITIIENGKVIYQKNFEQESVLLSEIFQDVKVGQEIIFSVLKVKRINYKSEIIEVSEESETMNSYSSNVQSRVYFERKFILTNSSPESDY